MKNLFFITLLICGVQAAWAQQCGVSCNIPPTYGRLCPNSPMWKANNWNAEDLIEIGYKKDSNGCYTLGNVTVKKTGSQSSMSRFYKKMRRMFGASAVQKTGF